MNYEEFVNKMKSDSSFRRLMVRAFYKYKDFSMVEKACSIPEGSFDKLFVEDPDFEEKFASLIEEEFRRIQRVIGWPRLNDALQTLASLADSLEDETKAVSAATALVRAQQALLELTASREQAEEEDDIDKLWKIVENEQTTKNSKTDKEDLSGIRK